MPMPLTGKMPMPLMGKMPVPPCTADNPEYALALPAAHSALGKWRTIPHHPIMRLKHFAFLSWAAVAVLAANFCQAQQLVVAPDRASGVYQVGDAVHWRVEWKDKTNPPPVHYRLLKGQLTEAGQGDINFTNNAAGLEAKLDAPGTMLVVATWKTAEGREGRATAGAVAAPEHCPVRPVPG